MVVPPFLGASIFPWGLFPFKKAPKTFGFYHIMMNLAGQLKKEKA
jgi:hypothetical protein